MKRAIVIVITLAIIAFSAVANAQMFAMTFGNRTSAWTPASLNPIAWYKGDGNALDSSGANVGTWAGSPAYTTGKIGGGLSLNGTASINIGTTAVYRATSVSMWVYVAVTPTAGRQHFGAVNKVAFRTGGTENKLNWNVWNQGGTRYELAPASDTTVGAWTHYCGTWDGITSTVYINGAYSASRSASGTSLGSLSSELVIGPSNTGNIIDDVMIFDRALAAEEIELLYNESINKDGEAW